MSRIKVKISFEKEDKKFQDEVIFDADNGVFTNKEKVFQFFDIWYKSAILIFFDKSLDTIEEEQSRNVGSELNKEQQQILDIYNIIKENPFIRMRGN